MPIGTERCAEGYAPSARVAHRSAPEQDENCVERLDDASESSEITGDEIKKFRNRRGRGGED